MKNFIKKTVALIAIIVSSGLHAEYYICDCSNDKLLDKKSYTDPDIASAKASKVVSGGKSFYISSKAKNGTCDVSGYTQVRQMLGTCTKTQAKFKGLTKSK